MAITTTPYLPYVVSVINGTAPDLDTDTIKAALITSSYTPDTDAHDFFDDVVAYELAAGNGYTAGGGTLTTPTVTTNTTDNRGEIKWADYTWTFTASKAFRYMVLYKSTGTDSTSPLIMLVDFGGTRTESSGFRIKSPATGLIQFRSTTQTI